jgi:hypothetical protein
MFKTKSRKLNHQNVPRILFGTNAREAVLLLVVFISKGVLTSPVPKGVPAKPFTFISGQTINVYPSTGCTGTVTVFTYNDAVSADVNGECRVDLIGTNPHFSLTDR